jgi:hypothetical protein
MLMVGMRPHRGARDCSPDRDRLRADQLPEVGRGAARDDLAAVDDADAVGQRVCLVQVLGGQQHGDPVACQGPDHPPCLLPPYRVQAGGRLIQEDHGRVCDQARGQVQAPPHPARIGRNPPPPATSASPDTFLQNPLGNPRASKPVLEWFPSFGPAQFAVSGAFGRAALWGYAAPGLAWPAAFAAIGLVIFRARTRHGR